MLTADESATLATRAGAIAVSGASAQDSTAMIDNVEPTAKSAMAEEDAEESEDNQEDEEEEPAKSAQPTAAKAASEDEEEDEEEEEDEDEDEEEPEEEPAKSPMKIAAAKSLMKFAASKPASEDDEEDEEDHKSASTSSSKKPRKPSDARKWSELPEAQIAQIRLEVLDALLESGGDTEAKQHNDEVMKGLFKKVLKLHNICATGAYTAKIREWRAWNASDEDELKAKESKPKPKQLSGGKRKSHEEPVGGAGASAASPAGGGASSESKKSRTSPAVSSMDITSLVEQIRASSSPIVQG